MRRFRFFAFWLALFQLASAPAAAWVDARMEAQARATQAQWGTTHAETPHAHHPWARHDADCALCAHLAVQVALAPAQPGPALVAARGAPTLPTVVGTYAPPCRALTLPRAPPSAA